MIAARRRASLLTTLRGSAPWDGEGWRTGDDPDLAEPRRRSAAAFRRRAGAFGFALSAAGRMAWGPASLWRSFVFARRFGLGGADAARVWRDCLLSGATPAEAHVWRGLHGGLHPLPGRACSLLLTRLGDPSGRALLGDKLAAEARLRERGLPVVATLAVIDGAGSLDAAPPPWACSGDLFVKPRRGFGGRGGFAIVRRDDGWAAAGDPPEPWPALRRRLIERAQGDALLVQPRLESHPDLADLSADGRPPVLRLITARLPGADPALHAALLEIPVPGRSMRRFLDGALRAPVDLATGRMTPAVLFGRPRERLAAAPWNRAAIAGRSVPDFAEAAAAVVAAAGALAPLPLVGWDVVATPTGPVVLEGNAAGNWIVATLPSRLGYGRGPSPGQVVARWSALGEI